MKKHFAIRVTGKVQGVYYRASAAEQARKLGITGFVRNEPDGSVYLEAEGEEQALQQLIAWCHQGPPRARVDKVLVEEKELINFTNFEIRR
ncbi:MAG: acylphosphatase [Cyclobacteriaceae bacterium]|nr:acylphosphatase [Cyclobacteriaceae bacterium]MCX7638465.1 acylphosphatase [Cyclobacteriaceae bacterium]MDW8331243.1 acylphosphatase [Cyclobacteriaceae bacterium]